MKQSGLKWGHSYHIYNRGNNRGQIFFEVENYFYFLRLFRRYLSDFVDLFAYCLLPNHFHFLLRIHEHNEAKVKPARQFGTFFGTYVKAINHRYHRTGSFFEGRYQRKEIKSENQFFITLVYIHQNPQRHGYMDRFQNWQFSSYTNYAARDPGDLISSDLLRDPLIYDSIMEMHQNIVKDAGC